MSSKLNIERTVIFSCKAGCIALYLMNPLITNWAQKTSKMCFGEVASPYMNLEIFKYRKILTLANHYTLLNCLKEHQVIMFTTPIGKQLTSLETVSFVVCNETNVF